MFEKSSDTDGGGVGYDELHADDIPDDAEERVNRIVEAVNERVDRIVTAVNDSISSAAAAECIEDDSSSEHVRSDSLANGKMESPQRYILKVGKLSSLEGGGT